MLQDNQQSSAELQQEQLHHAGRVLPAVCLPLLSMEIKPSTESTEVSEALLLGLESKAELSKCHFKKETQKLEVVC